MIDMTFDEINQLGRVIDTTWGKSSTASATGVAGHSCKVTMTSDGLNIMYSVVGTFASDQAMREQTKLYEHAADQVLIQAEAKIKTDFKTAAAKSLKLKKIDINDTWEIIGTQSHVSPKRTALYRRCVKYVIG